MNLNKQQFLTRVGLQVQTLELCLDHQWLIPDRTSTEMTFSDADIARAHLIRDLKSDFGVNDEGIDVILHLVDQLPGMRRAFEQLRRDVQEPSS
jgi:chaperone modulatory protein CbpM